MDHISPDRDGYWWPQGNIGSISIYQGRLRITHMGQSMMYSKSQAENLAACILSAVEDL